MTIVEEIKQMRSQNLTDEQIQDNLKARGISEKDITSALSQSKIKEAVEQEPFPMPKETQGNQMEKSLLPSASETTRTIIQQQPSPAGQTQESIPPQETIPPIQPQASSNEQIQEYTPPQGDYEEYQPYQSYTSGTSPEMITEISEQVVAEKLSNIRKRLEKALDSKNTLNTKIDYLEERLKRIEKIIDTLQSSILRKVGDYVLNVKDIKNELIETQKSLGKAFPKIGEKHSKKHQTKHKK